MSKNCRVISDKELNNWLLTKMPNDMAAYLLTDFKKFEFFKSFEDYLIANTKRKNVPVGYMRKQNKRTLKTYHNMELEETPLVSVKKINDNNFEVTTYPDSFFNKLLNDLIKDFPRKNDNNESYDQTDYLISQESQYEFLLQRKNEEKTSIEKSIAIEKDALELNRLNKELDAINAEIKKISEKPNFNDVMSMLDLDIEQLDEVLSKEKLSYRDLVYALDKIDFWNSDNFKQAFFSQEDIGVSPNWDIFESKLNSLNTYQNKFMNVIYDYIGKQINETTGKNFTEAELMDKMKKLKDTDGFQAYLRDMGTVDSEFIQTIDYIIKQESEKARVRILEFNNQLKDQLKKLQTKVGSKDPAKLYELFIQTNSKGNPTGNYTHRFSQSYFDQLKKLSNYDMSDKKQAKKKYNWYRENTILFDYRKLFLEDYLQIEQRPIDFTETDREKHIQELKNHLGEKGFEIYFEKAKKKFEEFKEQLQDIPEENLKEWSNQNSPFVYADKLNNTTIENTGRFYNFDVLVSVPRKFKTNGEPTGWYDSKFEKIEGDNSYLEFYNFLTDSLHKFKKYYPEDENLQSNFIPELRQSSFWKNILNSPTSITKELYDLLIDEISTNDAFKTHLSVTGKQKLSLPKYMMSDNLSKLTNMEKEILKDEAMEKYPPKEIDGELVYSKEFQDYYQKLIDNKLQQKLKTKSFDLGAVLMAHATASETYKHKAGVEDFLKISKVLVDQAQKQHLNPDGTPVKGMFGNVSQAEGLTNLKQSFNYMYESFYGKNKVQKLGKSIAKDSESKSKIKELEEKISKLDSTNPEELKKIEKFQEQIKSLQTQFNISATGDLILRYVHVKGMGWNPISAATNLGFGVISNLIHSAGGEDFNESQWLKAMYLLKENVFKSATLDSIETKNALKIGILMKEYGVIGDIREQGDYKTHEDIKSKLAILLPYQLTTRAEFLNQGSTFLAMMLNTPILNKKGESKNLYDAYILNNKNELVWDNENFDEGDSWMSIGNKKIKFQLKMREVQKIVHGNYDIRSAVMMKKTLLGRATLMFRNWVAEGFANRMQSERYMVNLERNVKGRYRSFYQAKTLTGEEVSVPMSIKYTLHEMARILTKGLYKHNGINNLSATDKVNLQKNAMELNLYLGLMAVAMILKSLGEDDDDNKYFLNFMLNNINRLQDDVTFYTSPMSFEKISRNAIPAFSFITDLAKWNKAFYKYLNGEDGINNSTTLEEATLRLFPFGWAYYRTKAVVEDEQIWR